MTSDLLDFTSAKVLGQLTNASNTTLLIEHNGVKYVYKPRSGERQLWDFETGTLCLRERASYLVSELLNWDLVPLTQLVDGPAGFGSAQLWVEADIAGVDIFPPSEIPNNWISVTSGVTEDGSHVVLAHADDEHLQKIALFDALINNADRKAGHLLRTDTGQLKGIDHGVTFNVDDKLRTVLWGWLEQEIPHQWLKDIEVFIEKIDESELDELLTEDEISQLLIRAQQLLEIKKFPSPSGNWPPVPWPIF